MQELLQSQIAIMEKSISRITDVAIALEDSRWGRPAKASSKPKPTQTKGKGKVSGSDDDMDAENNDEQEAAPVVDDAEEKRNEQVTKSTFPSARTITDRLLVDGEVPGRQSEATHR